MSQYVATCMSIWEGGPTCDSECLLSVTLSWGWFGPHPLEHWVMSETFLVVTLRAASDRDRHLLFTGRSSQTVSEPTKCQSREVLIYMW